ncbi:unnamed protein product [Prorocentrum cordatum]|uniref:ABC transporter domain-containing protein n=1 Tax=Prorocentrum cordatum TaxID=2364126 RepID=A0ABN9X333_9DINO|nr:unnamed protein product [Polarella glacialis]
MTARARRARAPWAAVLLLPPQVAGDASFDGTCVLPIREGQSLADSELWAQMLDGLLTSHGHRGGVPDLSDTGVDEKLRPAFDGLDPVDGSGPGLGGTATPKLHKSLLKLVERDLAIECGRAAGFSLQSAVEGASRVRVEVGTDRLEALRKGAGGRRLVEQQLINRGMACRDQCGQRAGNCSTGFCGGGVCCKRWAFHPDCPIGFRGGCTDRHCCVARPAMPGAITESRCHAEPGKFCLWSLVRRYSYSISPVETCMLQQSIMMCPPGFFCPGGTKAPHACPRGSVCMGGTVEPRSCPEGSFCPISILRQSCEANFSCPENSTKAEMCPAGSFCPSGAAITCPRGHFCATGVSRPQGCAAMASCPEGSEHQDWLLVAALSLALALLTWTVAVRSVPRWHQKGGCGLPAVAAIVVLGLAWGARFDAMALLAALCWRRGGWENLRMQALLDGRPHVMPLVMLTGAACVLVYGSFVSARIPDRRARLRADLAAGTVGALALMVGLRDLYACVLLTLNAGVCVTVWLILAQRGTLRLRLGLLLGGLALQFLAFLILGAGDMAVAQVYGLLATVIQASLWDVVPCCLAAAVKRTRRLSWLRRGSMPERTPSNSLIDAMLEMVPPEASAAEKDSAAAVRASARASFSEGVAEGESGAACGSLTGAMDREAWAPWVTYWSKCHSDLEGSSSEGAAAVPKSGVSFDLRGVGYRLASGRALLHELNLVVPPGATVAVMGASGSGKTTLLSVLSGRCGDRAFEGEMRLNGAPVQPWQMAELRPLMGYVPQDDVMHLKLTVRECVQCQAELRLRREAEAAEEPELTAPLLQQDSTVDGRIEDVLDGLELTHVADRVISDGLSGGQRKRVSIAMELVAKPKVLHLDEPSTGLDSATAHHILQIVLQCAKDEECTAFATIHQPRWGTLCLFEMLLLMAPGGYLCFAGPVAAAKPYFEKVLGLEFSEDSNPADVIIDACTFDSARSMAMEGTWRPPQCLRAVLFPTPQAASQQEEPLQQAEVSSPWQQEEFGKVLTWLWSEFTAIHMEILRRVPQSEGGLAHCGGEEDGLLLPTLGPLPAGARRLELLPGGRVRKVEASLEGSLQRQTRERVQSFHWAQQVSVQFSRALLVMSRSLSTICHGAEHAAPRDGHGGGWRRFPSDHD